MKNLRINEESFKNNRYYALKRELRNTKIKKILTGTGAILSTLGIIPLIGYGIFNVATLNVTGALITALPISLLATTIQFSHKGYWELDGRELMLTQQNLKEELASNIIPKL